MTPERFYELIDAARGDRAQNSPSADPEELERVLAALSDGELGEFLIAYEAELVRLNRWSVWGAGYAAADGMSDDGFHYFRSWLIGKGRDVVEVALALPDDLADFVDGSELENEMLEYAGLEVLGRRGLDEPDALTASSDDDPEGEPFDEDTVAEQYPRLAEYRF